MKKPIRILVFILLSSSLFIFNACKESDDEPAANLITSNSGINVSLTWLTGGTTSQAVIDADLDIRGYNKNAVLESDLPVNWSENEDSFEDFTLYSTQPDGDYYIKVLMFENFAGKAITFTVAVSGGGKEMKADGNYAAIKMKGDGSYASSEAALTVRSVMKITKSGNNYTVTNQ